MAKSRGEKSGAAALPSKEQSFFRNMFCLIEHKHYKKAIKQADLILKKFPDHGETLSMKALILSNMGAEKKQEAYDLAKKGLRLDLRSYVCWHVLGTMYRTDKDYVEATKCFAQAFRLSPENAQIAKDYSVLQIHERKFKGFRETRRQILATRSQYIREWTPFALANHLCGALDTAVAVLSEMEKQFEDHRELDASDKSELMLYCASILEEAGKLDECLIYLQARQDKIVDKMSLLEMQGRLLLAKGCLDGAREVYHKLFTCNGDNEIYALVLLACSADQRLRRLCRLPQFLSGNDGNHTEETTGCCVEVLPGSLDSTGEGRAGWLPAAAVRKKLKILTAAATAASSTAAPTAALSTAAINSSMVPLAGWKRVRGSTPAPLFVVTREPSNEEQQLILQFFEDLQRDFPSSAIPSYFVLSFLTGANFRVMLDKYLQPSLRRGVISLFSSLRRLQTKNNIPIIVDLLESYANSLQNYQTFTPPSAVAAANSSSSDGGGGNGAEVPFTTTAAATGCDGGATTSTQSTAWAALKKKVTATAEDSSLTVKREDVTADDQVAAPISSGQQQDELCVPNEKWVEDAEKRSQQQREGELPMCLLYTYMLLAQQYDFLGLFDEALAAIDKAIRHTPTLPDVYVIKGKIYKHAGDYKAACQWHEKARSLDLADRHLNTKCCNYLLRTNCGEEATATARLFTRQSDAEDLHGLQCMWFEQKLGKQHFRRNCIGPALFEFSCILRQFRDIREDQFDFHPFCLRRFAYRAYLSFLRMQDKLFSHLFLRRAARRYIRIYLAIHDGEIDLAAAKNQARAYAEAAAAEKEAVVLGTGFGGRVSAAEGGSSSKKSAKLLTSRTSSSSASALQQQQQQQLHQHNNNNNSVEAASATSSAVVPVSLSNNSHAVGSISAAAATASVGAGAASSSSSKKKKHGCAASAVSGVAPATAAEQTATAVTTAAVGVTAATGGGATATAAAEKKDISGYALLEKDPLQEAVAVLQELLRAALADQHTHVLHYHVAARMQKGLAMLLALMRLWRLVDKNILSPRVVPLLYHFCNSSAAAEALESERDGEVVRAALGQLLPAVDCTYTSAADYLEKHKIHFREKILLPACLQNPFDFRLRKAALEALLFSKDLSAVMQPQSPLLAFQPFPSLSEYQLRLLQLPTLRDCERLSEVLALLPPSASRCKDIFQAICRARFPQAEAFRASEEEETRNNKQTSFTSSPVSDTLTRCQD